jgi:hypothetical protein
VDTNSRSTASSIGGWPPAALGLGGRCLSSEASHRTAVGRGGWRALTAVCRGGRSLPPLQTAVGTQPPFETVVRGYFCRCWIRLFIFVWTGVVSAERAMVYFIFISKNSYVGTRRLAGRGTYTPMVVYFIFISKNSYGGPQCVPWLFVLYFDLTL